MSIYVVPYCRFCNAPGGLHGGRGVFHWGRCNNNSPDGRPCDCPQRLNNMRDDRWPLEPRREQPPAEWVSELHIPAGLRDDT